MINGRTDTKGMLLLHVQTPLMQGVILVKGQDMLFEPVLKRIKLPVIHALMFCLGRKGSMTCSDLLLHVFSFRENQEGFAVS